MRFGEFMPPEDSSAATWQSAKSFLETLDHELPAVKKSLWHDVWPVYRNLQKTIIENQLSYKIPSDGFKGIILQPDKEPLHIIEKESDALDSWDSLKFVSENYYPELLPLKSALLRWGTSSFRWPDPWMLNRGIDTLRYWIEHQLENSDLESYPDHKTDWHYGGFAYYMPDVPSYDSKGNIPEYGIIGDRKSVV